MIQIEQVRQQLQNCGSSLRAKDLKLLIDFILERTYDSDFLDNYIEDYKAVRYVEQLLNNIEKRIARQNISASTTFSGPFPPDESEANNGDLWIETSNLVLYIRIGGSWVNFTTGSSSSEEGSYTILLQSDGNGVAISSKIKANEGDIITLSYDPLEGYVFNNWEVLSGYAVIVGNQFIMPAENIAIKANFKLDTQEPIDPEEPNNLIAGYFEDNSQYDYFQFDGSFYPGISSDNYINGNDK